MKTWCKKNGIFFSETRSVWMREWRRQWTVTDIRGKNWKVFENCLKNIKLAFFATWTSRQGKPQNTVKVRNMKISLSVFRDWKVYPRRSRELSCENLWVTLAIGPSTHEQVAKLSREKLQNSNFEKFSKSFSRLGYWLASKSRKISEWARDWGLRLSEPAT